MFIFKTIIYTFISTSMSNGTANKRKKITKWDWQWYPHRFLHSETSLWPTRHKGSSLWHVYSQRCLFQVRIIRAMILQSSYGYNSPALKTFTTCAIIWRASPKYQQAPPHKQNRNHQELQEYSWNEKNVILINFTTRQLEFLNQYHPCFQLCHRRQQIEQLLKDDKESFLQKIMVHKMLDAKILSNNLCSSCFQKKHSYTQPWVWGQVRMR